MERSRARRERVLKEATSAGRGPCTHRLASAGPAAASRGPPALELAAAARLTGPSGPGTGPSGPRAAHWSQLGPPALELAAARAAHWAPPALELGSLDNMLVICVCIFCKTNAPGQRRKPCNFIDFSQRAWAASEKMLVICVCAFCKSNAPGQRRKPCNSIDFSQRAWAASERMPVRCVMCARVRDQRVGKKTPQATESWPRHTPFHSQAGRKPESLVGGGGSKITSGGRPLHLSVRRIRAP